MAISSLDELWDSSPSIHWGSWGSTAAPRTPNSLEKADRQAVRISEDEFSWLRAMRMASAARENSSETALSGGPCALAEVMPGVQSENPWANVPNAITMWWT